MASNYDDDEILDGVEFGELPLGVCPACMGFRRNRFRRRDHSTVRFAMIPAR
jgi:hypothetical protein